MCASCGPDGPLEDVDDRIEQSVVCCLAEAGSDFDDKAFADDIACCGHDEVYARRAHSNKKYVVNGKRIHMWRLPCTPRVDGAFRRSMDTVVIFT